MWTLTAGQTVNAQHQFERSECYCASGVELNDEGLHGRRLIITVKEFEHINSEFKDKF